MMRAVKFTIFRKTWVTVQYIDPSAGLEADTWADKLFITSVRLGHDGHERGKHLGNIGSQHIVDGLHRGLNRFHDKGRHILGSIHGGRQQGHDVGRRRSICRIFRFRSNLGGLQEGHTRWDNDLQRVFHRLYRLSCLSLGGAVFVTSVGAVIVA